MISTKKSANNYDLGGSNRARKFKKSATLSRDLDHLDDICLRSFWAHLKASEIVLLLRVGRFFFCSGTGPFKKRAQNPHQKIITEL